MASQGVGAVPTYDFAIGRATDKDKVKQHQVKFNVHRLIFAETIKAEASASKVKCLKVSNRKFKSNNVKILKPYIFPNTM